MVEMEVRCFTRQVVTSDCLRRVDGFKVIVLLRSRNMRLISDQQVADGCSHHVIDGTGLINISSRLQMPYPACISAEKNTIDPAGISTMTGSNCLPARDDVVCLCRLRLLFAPSLFTILSHLCDMG